MSAIQLLEKIGADAALRANKEVSIDKEIKELIDLCPDVYAFLAPAKEDSPSEDKQSEEDEKETEKKMTSNKLSMVKN